MPALVPIRLGSSPEGTPLRPLVPGVVGASGPVNACGIPPPPMVSGVVGWWDASCGLSITIALGNPFFLAAIADGSGFGNDMVKLGSSNWPIYSPTLFNGLPGVQITATDLCSLYCPTAFPMGTGNTLTAWYVGSMTALGSNTFGRILSYAKPSGDDSSNVGSWNVNAGNSLTTVRFERNVLFTTSTSGAGIPAGHTFIFTIDPSGVMTVYVDGVASSTVTSPGNWVDGGNLAFGGEATGAVGGYWRGVAGEWGVATGYTNPTNVAALDLALKAKWSL